MAFAHGRTCRVMYNSTELSAFFTQAEENATADNPKTTTFTNTAARRQVVGLKDATVTLQGNYDSAANAVDVVLAAAIGAANPGVVSIGPSGYAVGDRAKLISAMEAKYAVSSPVEGVVTVNADLEADGGLDAGVWQHPLQQETGNGNSASIDNGAATSNGAVGHIHVTASSGALTVKVRHSTDDSTYADLINFTPLAGSPTQERVAVAGTVNRYTREERTGFVANNTYAVSFARR